MNVIFLDGSLEDFSQFKPVFIKSNFTHVYVVVAYCRVRAVVAPDLRRPLATPPAPAPLLYTCFFRAGDGLVPHVGLLREVGAAVRPLAAQAGGLQEQGGVPPLHPRQDDQRREGHVSSGR